MMLKEAAALILFDELKKEAALNNLLNFIKQAALDEGDILPIAGAAGVGGLASGIAQKRYTAGILNKLQDAVTKQETALDLAEKLGNSENTAWRRADFFKAVEDLARADKKLRQRLLPAALAGALLSGGGAALYQHYFGD